MKSEQTYSSLPIKISCMSINFKKLDESSLEILKSSSFPESPAIIEKFKKKLGFKVEQLSIIKKCNAVMIFVVSSRNISSDFLKNRVLDVWDSLSVGGIINYLNHVLFYEDEAAVKYIAECALGLNSVTIGDSQVFAQISNAISSDGQKQNENPTFMILVGWLKILLEETKEKTSIFSGNTSLERIAAKKVSLMDGDKKNICILGLGMSGSLLVKILSEEYKYNVSVANRNKEKVSEILKKHPELNVIDIYDTAKIAESDVIILALDHNEETVSYFVDLSKSIAKSSSPKILIDLSSPSFCDKNKMANVSIIDVTDLSKEANKTINDRASEVNKVRQIVDKKLSFFSERLKKEIGKIDIENQKSFASSRLSPSIVNIIKVRSKVFSSIREHLFSKSFYEINTPYIVGVSTDPPKVDKGGAIEVVWPKGEQAFLRQSNQLYKQMVVVSGVEKVFEIGPFWRAESENTFRHLEESIGLDVEFSSPGSLEEVFMLAYSVIFKVYEGLKKVDMASFEVTLLEPEKLPIITYEEAVSLLNKNGFPFQYGVDLGVIGEAKLGEIIQKKDHSDAFVITHYPSNIKKFYTKQSNSFLTETFDIIVGGWELVSGALREVNREKIEHSMKLSGINPIDYNFYLSMINDAVDHGGFGMGVDRLVAKLLNIDVISDAVAFPRTFNRLIP